MGFNLDRYFRSIKHILQQGVLVVVSILVYEESKQGHHNTQTEQVSDVYHIQYMLLLGDCKSDQLSLITQYLYTLRGISVYMYTHTSYFNDAPTKL